MATPSPVRDFGFPHMPTGYKVDFDTCYRLYLEISTILGKDLPKESLEYFRNFINHYREELFIFYIQPTRSGVIASLSEVENALHKVWDLLGDAVAIDDHVTERAGTPRRKVDCSTYIALRDGFSHHEFQPLPSHHCSGDAIYHLQRLLYETELTLQAAKLAKKGLQNGGESYTWGKDTISGIRRHAIIEFAAVFREHFGKSPTVYEDGNFAKCLRHLCAAIRFVHDNKPIAMNLPNRIEDILSDALSAEEWKTESSWTWGLGELLEMEGARTQYRVPEK